jgi:hypothetical protein
VSVEKLSDADRQLLEARGFEVSVLRGEVTALALRSAVNVDAVIPSRAKLLQTRAELTHAFSQVSAFLARVSRPADPYR